MDAVHARLTARVAALSSGDATAAAATFDPAATISVREGHTLVVVMPAGQATRLITAAFADIGYIPVLRREAEGLLSDDGVLTGTHQAAFLGVPGDGRRVRLNVHLKAELRADGRLGDMDLETSVAALRHQLLGSGPPAAMADGLVAEVRERSNRAVSMLEDAEVETVLSPTAPRRRWSILAIIALVALVVVAVTGVAAIVTGRVQSPLDAGAPGGHPTVAISGSIPAPTSALPLSSSSPSAPPATAPTPMPTPTPTPVQPSILPVPADPTVQAGTQVVLASDVLFGFDSAQLGPQAQAALADLAIRIIAAHLSGRIQVNGYTDNLGSSAHGLALSQQRASAVAQLLQGLLTGQPVTLAPQGFGEADPVADNATPQGQALNRRVTIILPTAR